MPATRRARTSGGGAAAAKSQQQQSKLSFAAGGTKSKVTKSTTAQSKEKGAEKKKADLDVDTSVVEATPSQPETKDILLGDDSQISVEKEVKQSQSPKAEDENKNDTISSTEPVLFPNQSPPKKTNTPLNRPAPESQKLAEKVTDAQIKKYWRAREEDRIAPRVHQEGLSVEEKVLRLFDMSSQFGPAIGIPRMKRWVRANKLGLNPPIEVLAVLLKEEKKGNKKIERAHVDELMASKFVVGEA